MPTGTEEGQSYPRSFFVELRQLALLGVSLQIACNVHRINIIVVVVSVVVVVLFKCLLLFSSLCYKCTPSLSAYCFCYSDCLFYVSINST